MKDLTVKEYLESLIAKREQIQLSISEIEDFLDRHKTAYKRKAILKAAKSTNTKGFKYNGTHWTQRPENKNRVAKHLKRISRLKNANK